jgi:hypothetical protein
MPTTSGLNFQLPCQAHYRWKCFRNIEKACFPNFPLLDEKSRDMAALFSALCAAWGRIKDYLSISAHLESNKILFFAYFQYTTFWSENQGTLTFGQGLRKVSRFTKKRRHVILSYSP